MWAHEEQHINSLDPNCGGPCDANGLGGPTLEVAGVASVGRQRFTPQPRTNDRIQIANTITYAGGSHVVKAGFDFGWLDSRDTALPLHFGGRYLFRALPAIPGLIPQALTPIQAVAAGIPAAYIQGYGEPGGPYRNKDLSLFIQDEWRIGRKFVVKPGLRYQYQWWPDYQYNVSDLGGANFNYGVPERRQRLRPSPRGRLRPRR